jgi:acyl carrier protein
MSNADIRAILDAHAKLPVSVNSLADDASLFAAGMTSLASVEVILALEEKFGIEFPDQLMHRRTFCTISAIEAAVSGLKAAA